MGKGDVKSKKGKLFRGSYGVRRPRKKNKIKKRALQKNPQDNAPELQEKMSEIKVGEKEKQASKTTKSSKTQAKSSSGQKKKASEE